MHFPLYYCRNIVLCLVSVICIASIFGLFQFQSGAGTFNIQNAYKSLTADTAEISTCLSYNDFIQVQLKVAQRNWNRARDKQVGRPPVHESKIWNFFAPTFSCPLPSERLGRVGDGGKWVCGFSQLLSKKSNCLIYSFGVGYEQSFEEEVMERSNCTIRMFDPTIYAPPPVVANNPNRAFWYKIGIADKDSSNSEYLTLKSIMKKFGEQDRILEVLKMDVEGAEWKSMANVPKDFPKILPFAQFLFEIHMSKSESENFDEFKTWWRTLENHGLRPFSIELNYAAAQMFKYSEYAMLNINVDPFILRQP